jgi:diguanylate cyclase (GGDEF)-like protein
LRQVIEQTVHPVYADKSSFQVTVSIGLATINHESGTVGDLIHCADAALYHAKRSGRNRVSVYDPSFDDGTHSKISG